MVSAYFFRLREFVTSGAQPHFYIIFNQGLQKSYLCVTWILLRGDRVPWLSL